MIILSIIKIFYIINIEFAILVAADDNYKIVIKKYKDYINYEDLIEILYETITIKRFRNNILKTIKNVTKNLKSENRNTIFLSFFDCMDYSFTYPNYWLKDILNNEKFSFFFIIEKTRLYQKGEYKEIINNMFKTFENKIKNCASKFKIFDLYSKDFDLYNNDIDLENFFPKFLHL